MRLLVFEKNFIPLRKINTMEVQEIANQFNFEGTIESVAPLGEGFINDTFVVKTADNAPDYILQRKNKKIFPNVPAMMENIVNVTDHLRKKVLAAGGDPDSEVLRVIYTRNGAPYFVDDAGQYWAACVFVPDSVTYAQADTPALAAKGGEGIGKFHAMLMDFDKPINEIIPGFHNMEIRLEQWDEAVKADRAGRVADVAEEIGWIEEHRRQMMEFQKLVDNGTIPKRVTHNDTKITNILFDRQGAVKCVIDLDTLMSAPIHNDMGDSIRTYANTGAEDDRDLTRVSMSLPMFEGYVKGYLSQVGHLLTPAEIEWLPFAPLFITYEQTLRFLMDYINGDTYYKIKYPEHNLDRTRAQYALFKSMLEQYPMMKQIVYDNIP